MKHNTLVLATTNQGKINELRELLKGFDLRITGLNDYDNCPTVEEDGLTFKENAIKKAVTISEYLNLPALADDSGLEVDALGGKPGVFSARFAGPDATDEENMSKLIDSMRGVDTVSPTARFRCVLALAVPSKPVWTCDGECSGEILLEPRGENGFGYDPIFYLPEWGKTMAQLDKDEKNRISHRGKAVRYFCSQIDQLL